VFGSPLLHDGVCYVLTADCHLYAFDATAAAKGSQTPLIDGRQLFPEDADSEPVAYASLTRAGKYLFASNTRGQTVVMEATREAKVLARNQLPKGAGGNPAFAGKELFLRDGDKLYCIGE
jgi:hypothetical protein